MQPVYPDAYGDMPYFEASYPISAEPTHRLRQPHDTAATQPSLGAPSLPLPPLATIPWTVPTPPPLPAGPSRPFPAAQFRASGQLAGYGTAGPTSQALRPIPRPPLHSTPLYAPETLYPPAPSYPMSYAPLYPQRAATAHRFTPRPAAPSRPRARRRRASDWWWVTFMIVAGVVIVFGVVQVASAFAAH